MTESAARAEPEVLWRPSADRIGRATITRYLRWLEQERGLSLPDYDALWRWSVEDLEGFWSSIKRSMVDTFHKVSKSTFRSMLSSSNSAIIIV